MSTTSYLRCAEGCEPCCLGIASVGGHLHGHQNAMEAKVHSVLGSMYAAARQARKCVASDLSMKIYD